MNKIKVIATTSFGLETVLGFELKAHNFNDFIKENGRVIINTEIDKIPFLNINLRTAERILIKLTDFKCVDFDDLYDNLIKINWYEFMPIDSKINIILKTVKSTIKSISNAQSISKKAVIETLKKKYNQDWFSETGPVFKINVFINNDIAEVLLDTSGHGLHKRGYRLLHGEAPLKETIAASILDISRQRADEILIDPFCGSGTILIEAALKFKNIAPGLNASFDSENWPIIDQQLWDKERKTAKNSERSSIKLQLFGFDIDPDMIKIAKENAKRAGVLEDIVFEKNDFNDLKNLHEKATIITNPPYGERLDTEIDKLYEQISNKLSMLTNYRIFIFTGIEHFGKYIKRKYNKNRKLYNGKIKCYLYMFFQKR